MTGPSSAGVMATTSWSRVCTRRVQPTPQYPQVVVVVADTGRRSRKPGSDSAPVGQELTQPPQATQSEPAQGPPLPGATTVA